MCAQCLQARWLAVNQAFQAQHLEHKTPQQWSGRHVTMCAFRSADSQPQDHYHDHMSIKP